MSDVQISQTAAAEKNRNTGIRGLYRLTCDGHEHPDMYKLTEIQAILSNAPCDCLIQIEKVHLPKKEKATKKCKTEESH